ncbi:ribosome recycling factor [Parvularcula dongshanensis]|uniref:Ribosome-recycling factor n=1 Tax=Parvularcula dongshanensis TaxID=1173995 RepID=A0A840I2X3_9PROT|nr:ribosome recycling factor [Parvularcula dongshanensis]MBB4658631.1 ribosome recycling factor [Parvularcula dongshanensis]
MADGPDFKELEKRMDGALAALKTEFGGLRSGRATANLLEPVVVNAYGSDMPLNQVGTIGVPDARTLAVNVWDKGLVGAVEKAIRNSGLGLNPVTDGQTVRVPMPPMTEERRRDLAKMTGKYAEAAKVAIRNVRRDGMDEIKAASDMPEDDQKKAQTRVQDLTDAKIKEVDRLHAAKEEEIMQV